MKPAIVSLTFSYVECLTLDGGEYLESVFKHLERSQFLFRRMRNLERVRGKKNVSVYGTVFELSFDEI